jgi:hypothetical protein
MKSQKRDRDSQPSKTHGEQANAMDDKSIVLLQEVLQSMGINLDHPCAGTLVGFADCMVLGRLLKAECLASGSDMVAAFYDTEGYPKDKEAELRAFVERVNQSKECRNNEKQWLRLAVCKPDKFDQIHISLIVELTPQRSETITVEHLTGRLRTAMIFASLNWPE